MLVVGGGGREHALVWKLRRSRRAGKLYCAPGNGGIAELAELAPIAATDCRALVEFAEVRRIGLTIVGPELPLTSGIVDEFEARGLRVFGPCRAAAELEASKVFAKHLMREAGVAQAAFEVFTDPARARSYVAERNGPIVVKADGLAAGKGVFVCDGPDGALRAIDELMVEARFGDAGRRVVIEERLGGEEASFLALVDGTTVVPLATSQDHKRIGDGDTGPNTGGMGAYSPAPVVTPEVERRVMAEVFRPLVAALRAHGIKYKGVLYAGLMIEHGSPRVLEFNVRFGDPECQPLMLRLTTDLIDVCEAVIEERLAELSLGWDPRAAACVVLAARGYPDASERGARIDGLELASELEDIVVFHAGTRRAPGSGAIEADGGRVLGVTALGKTIADAVARAYGATRLIHFAGMQFRRDIGRRAIERGG